MSKFKKEIERRVMDLIQSGLLERDDMIFAQYILKGLNLSPVAQIRAFSDKPESNATELTPNGFERLREALKGLKESFDETGECMVESGLSEPYTIEEIEDALKLAVENEDYETAAELRDELNKLKGDA